MNDSAASGSTDLARVFARLFRGADGARALAHLRSLTVDRHLGPEASIARLRHLEGQRHLVNHILSLVRLGAEGRNFETATESKEI